MNYKITLLQYNVAIYHTCVDFFLKEASILHKHSY